MNFGSEIITLSFLAFLSGLLLANAGIAAQKSLNVLLSSGNFEILFQIGQFDNSPTEFALAPSEATKFAERFPDGVIYTVGKSTSKDWPFIHPNEADAFWAVKKVHPFLIKFNLKESPKGNYAFFIDLFDIHESLAPLMEIFVNGQIQSFQMPTGTGRAYFGPCPGQQHIVYVPIKTQWLRKGENEIIITLKKGSWVAYDALALLRRKELKIPVLPRQMEPHALTIIPRIDDFEVKGPLLEEIDGKLHAIFASHQDHFTTKKLIPNERFDLEFDFCVLSGAFKVAFQLPEENMGNVWELNLDVAKKNRWYHAKVRNIWYGGDLNVRDLRTKEILFSVPFYHIDAPSVKLRFENSHDFLSEFLIANLFYTSPVAVKADKIAYLSDETANLILSLGEHKPVVVELVIQGQRGKTVHKESQEIPPDTREMLFKVPIAGLPDGLYRSYYDVFLDKKLTLSGSEEVNFQVATKKARRTKSIIASAARQVAENKPRLSAEVLGYTQWALKEANRAYQSGDFDWALSCAKKAVELAKKPKDKKAYCQTKKGQIVTGNDYFELRIDIKDRINPNFLIDKRTGRIYADAPYIYQVTEAGQLRPFYKGHKIRHLKDGRKDILLSGQMNKVKIEHRFIVPKNQPYLEEIISIQNLGKKPFNASKTGCGFGKIMRKFQRKWMEGLDKCRLVAVPYRRDPMGRVGEYEDYSLDELRWKKGWFYPGWGQPKIYTPQHGAEGWVWTDGEFGMLIAKHSNEMMEFSLLQVVQRGSQYVLRFGGCGTWKLGDPEAAHKIETGQKITFGTTRYTFFKGGWKEGYYAFRDFMAEKGHKAPQGFNPPVHWNELYDNPLWWGPDTPENRKKYYSLPDMEQEAKKAQEIGCEALYLDPGWDTTFASSIWAQDRLLPPEEFVKLMKSKYGLQVSLHTPLAAWCDINAYPMEARRKDAEGKILEGLCSAAPAYIEEKSNRLIQLASKGIAYFMFDGSGYTGPCYDKSHGHSIPLTREEHCRAILKIAQKVHQKFPKVLIELHDPIVAGVPIRYAPTYYLHDIPYSFDEVWAFEFMWDPMEDLLSGRAISLYYYNLAYSLPLYIHIDLRHDTENCLEFWWFASTCRHLGIGGKHKDHKVWEAHKKAMKDYLRLKEFYTQGIFYGLSETVHVHTLPERQQAVINLFNLCDQPHTKTITFELQEIGLNPKLRIQIIGAQYAQRGSKVTLNLNMLPRSARLVELKVP